MTEDGASVDSVTGELAIRLGAVGGYAGEAMRRGVRDAAGGAQTIASLVQADAAAAQRVEPADIAAPDAPGPAKPPASAERPLPEAERPLPAGKRSLPDDELTETGAADNHPGSRDRSATADSPKSTATGGAVGDRPAPDPAATPHAAAEAHPGPDTAAPVPAPPGTATHPSDPEQHPSDRGQQPADPGQQPAVPAPAADDRPGADAALPPGEPIAAATGHQTPWTPAGAEQASGHTPGPTPWNSGAGSSMPYLPGMPGGGLGSLTPQERPPRGSAPWSRGRGGQEETAFPRPRPRPDRPASTNRMEWAPP